MTEAEWADNCDPTAMLSSLWRRVSERKLRLFGCACCRRIWDPFTDARCCVAVEVVERYAEGLATPEEMEEAERAARDARTLAVGPRSTASRRHEMSLGLRTAWAAYELTYVPVGDDACEAVRADVREAAEYARGIRGQGRHLGAAQADLLRDVVGNPFRAQTSSEGVLSRTNGAVVNLACAAYEERQLRSGALDNDRLLVLADALEEVGCAHQDVVCHLRQPGAVHVRGCWVVDLLLTKG
jgi:hypothetical protein